MRILIISDAWHPQVNGVVRTYEYLIEELQKLGHEILVTGPSDYKIKMPMPGYSEIKLVLAPMKKLKAIIKDFAPEHIHIATEGPLGWKARNHCHKHKIPFTTSYHTHFPDYVAKRFAKYLPFTYNWAFETAKKVVRKFHAPAKSMMIATESLEDELKSWDFKTPIKRLSRGVVLAQFRPAETPASKTEFQDMKGPIALYVGRIAIEKNLEAFLDMDWDGTKVLIGDGPSRLELEKRYPQAHFIGKREGDELGACYRSADIFVFPSKTDTFGIVLIEALASGLPVAAFNVTGPKDIITEDFLGALTEDDLGAAAKTALNCGNSIKRADYTRKTYSWENCAKQFLDAL